MLSVENMSAAQDTQVREQLCAETHQLRKQHPGVPTKIKITKRKLGATSLSTKCAAHYLKRVNQEGGWSLIKGSCGTCAKSTLSEGHSRLARAKIQLSLREWETSNRSLSKTVSTRKEYGPSAWPWGSWPLVFARKSASVLTAASEKVATCQSIANLKKQLLLCWDTLHGPLTWIDSCFGHQVDCICSTRPGEGASDSISLSGDTPHTQSGHRLVCSCGAGHTCWPGCFSFCLPTVLWEIDIKENLYIKDKNAKLLGLSGRIFLPRGATNSKPGDRGDSFSACANSLRIPLLDY